MRDVGHNISGWTHSATLKLHVMAMVVGKGRGGKPEITEINPQDKDKNPAQTQPGT